MKISQNWINPYLELQLHYKVEYFIIRMKLSSYC